MDLGIRGRVALVTGAAPSLGRADATALAAEGCAIAIVDLDGVGAGGCGGETETAGGRARGHACDNRESAQVQEVAGHIERELGAADIGVNYARHSYAV